MIKYISAFPSCNYKLTAIKEERKIGKTTSDEKSRSREGLWRRTTCEYVTTITTIIKILVCDKAIGTQPLLHYFVLL